MEKSLHYRSQRITVRATKGPSAPVSYDSQIFITNAVRVLNKSDKYPPKAFPTADEAIAYGLEAAKWLVDRGPAATTGGPLKKRTEQRHTAA